VSEFQNKALVFFAAAVIVLLAVSPLLGRVTVAPCTDYFTELYIYGGYHNATYPFAIGQDSQVQLYIEVANHQGESAQYMLQTKFRSHDQSGPGSFDKTSSSQPALESTTFSVLDGEVYELPMQVSFDYRVNKLSDQIDIELESATQSSEQLDMRTVTVNGNTHSLQGTTIAYDSAKFGFFGNIFFELYIYNTTVNSWQYDGRYVSLWLKMT
jgi:hypothetical protein